MSRMIAPDPLRFSDTTEEMGQNSAGLRAKLPHSGQSG